MTRQAVMQHLALLEAANLVVSYWHGREKLHYLNIVPLRETRDDWAMDSRVCAPLIASVTR